MAPGASTEKEEAVSLTEIWAVYRQAYKGVEPSVELFPATENILNALLYDIGKQLAWIREQLQQGIGTE